MRIRFFHPDDEAETAAYLETVAAIDAFWHEFGATLRRLNQPDSVLGERWVTHLRSWLGRVDAGLGLEIDQHADGLRHCVVLPFKDDRLLPLAQLVVERAPSRPPWVFSTRREATDLARCLEIVRADCGYDFSTARVRVGVVRGHSVEVIVGSELVQGADDEVAADAAQYLVSRLLGDEVFEQWIEQVSVVPQPRANPLQLVDQRATRLPLTVEQLPSALTAAVDGVVRGLPEHPCHVDCERAEWAMFEVERLERAGDDLPQSDLVVASSMRPEMLKCHLEAGSFASARFSRCGETFCYLKVRLPGEGLEQRIEARVHLEQVLDRALVPGRLGCVVGTGMGSEFAYLVFALTQLEPAIALIRKRLLDQHVGPEAWLLFCDSTLRDEWVGVGLGSPAPRHR